MSKFGLIYIFVFACGYSAFAEGLSTDSLHTNRLNEVVVNGRHSQNVRATMPVQQMSATELKRLNAGNAAEVTKYFSGATVKDYGGIGGLKTVCLRGFSAQHTGVSYDGVVVSDIQNGQIDLGRFSLENIGAVSLTNAQPNDIFQSARMFASAGVICLNTLQYAADSTSHTTGRATLKSGSFGLMDGTLFIKPFQAKKLSCNFLAQGIAANGKYPYLHDLDPANPNSLKQELNRKNSDVQSVRLEANARYTPRSNESVSLKANFFGSERGLPGSVISYNDYSNMRLWDNQFFAQALYQNKVSETFQHQITGKYSQSESRYHNINPNYGSTGTLTENFMQHEYYLSGTVQYSPLSRLRLSAATDGWYNDLQLNRTIGLEKSNSCNRFTSLSNVAAKYTTDWLSVAANVLYTHTQEAIANGSAAANRDKFSPTVSFSARVTDKEDVRIRGFYKNIFRVPTFNELYYQDMGNKNLLPETTNQYNIGAVYHTAHCPVFSELELSIDGYYNEVNNKIIATPKDLFHWSMVNKGKVEIKGVDITAFATVRLFAKSILLWHATYTWQKAVDALPSSANYGEQIPYTPVQSGSGSVSWIYRNVECGYNLLYSGKRWDGQNIAQNALHAYAEQSVFASLNITKLKLTGEIINLANSHYEVVRYYPMPGRNFRITASYEF